MQTQYAEMVMLWDCGSYFLPREEDVFSYVLRNRLIRMSHPIRVVAEVPSGDEIWTREEELVGYREADTGCVFVDSEQFQHYFC